MGNWLKGRENFMGVENMVVSDFTKWAKRFPEKGWCEDALDAKYDEEGNENLNCVGREIVAIPVQFPCGVCGDTFTVIHTHCSVCQKIVRIH